MAYAPGFLSLAQPGDPAWKPIVMGVVNGIVMFTMNFFLSTRFKAFMTEEERLELEEQADMKPE